MRRAFLLSLLILLSLYLSSQNGKIKSLRAKQAQLETHPNFPKDTAYINTINELAQQYAKSKPDSTLYFAQKATELSEKIGYAKGLEEGLKSLGSFYLVKGKHRDALKQFELLLSLYQKQNNQLGIASCLNNMGIVHSSHGQYAEAISFFTQSQKAREGLDDKKGAASCLNNFGIVYKNWGNYAEALKYFLASLKISEEIQNKPTIAITLNNIGTVQTYLGNYAEALSYHLQSVKIKQELNDKPGIANNLNNIGQIFEKQGKYTEAIKYHFESLKIKEEANDRQGIAYNLNNIGHIYSHQHNFTEALKYFTQSLKIKQEIDDKRGITYSLNDISNLYIQQKEFAKAQEIASKGLNLSKEIGLTDQIKQNLLSLSEASEGLGQYDRALSYFKQYKAYSDTVYNIEKEQDISRSMLERKMLENEQLQKDNILKTATIKMEQLAKDEKAHQLKVLEKQAEVERLLALANQELSMRKSDSLRNLAQKSHLENDKLLITKQKLSAEAKAKQVELEKNRKEATFYVTLIGLLLVSLSLIGLFTYSLFKSRQKEKRSKELLQSQKEQLQQVKEQLQVKATHLEHSNHSKDRIFAIVAHDLRSPLATLKNILDLRESNDLTPDELDEMLPLMSNEIDNSLELTEEILYWAKSQMGDSSINLTRVNLTDLLNEQAKRFENAAKAKGITIEVSCTSCECMVFADINMLRTIVRNLLSNAIKYCKSNDSITLSAQRNEKHTLISISDTGIGIPPENREKLFGLSTFTTRGTANEKGSGLGLTLCRDFVEKNKGRIWVESKEGKGSTFYFTLPQT